MRWICSCFFLFVSVLGYKEFRKNFWRTNYSKICHTVSDRFYKDSEELRKWVKNCLRDAERLPAELNKKKFVKRMKWRMEKIRVSHLGIHQPVAFRRQWQGQDKSTGIESRWVDGFLVVYNVWPESSGEKVGVQKGDIVLSIEERGLNESALLYWGGQLTLQRGTETLKKNVLPIAFKMNEVPVLQAYDDRTVILKIPSFRKEFFTKRSVAEWRKKIRSAKSVILDLRDNSGGNFIAGLRVMSLFFCQPTTLGFLDQPRQTQWSEAEFEDNLNDGRQIDRLESVRAIRLKTFPVKDCFDGPLTVLVDQNTASVSEVVSSAFKTRDCSQVIGSPTAGRVVMAIWFPITDFGEGYYISVPVALFKTGRLEVLEGVGLVPDQKVYYNIEKERLGKDTWIEHALENPPQCEVQSSRSDVYNLDGRVKARLSQNGTVFASLE